MSQVVIFTEIIEHECRAIGAYQIATEIRRAGFSCQVVDFFNRFSEEELKRVIDKFVGDDTIMVGFSSTFFLTKPNIPIGVFSGMVTGDDVVEMGTPHDTALHTWIARIKKKNPRVKMVLGGAKASLFIGPWDVFAVKYADRVIIDYLHYLQGKNPFLQFDRLNDTQIVIDGERCTPGFEFTESSVTWDKSDCIAEGETLPIEIARGCIFKCKFCAYPLNGKKKLDFIKHNSVLKDEFLRNYYEHGVTRYVYADDTHNDSIDKIVELHKVATSLPFQLEFAAYTRLDLLHAHRETPRLLMESGLRSAIFGIETLNHKSGISIGKGLHPDKTKETLYWLKEDIWKNEVATASGFIIGLPYDTPETVHEWSRWLLDPACPLDQPSFLPLYINRHLGKKTPGTNIVGLQSEFALSADKYGYKFDTGVWSNEHFDFHSAHALAMKYHAEMESISRTRIAGFSAVMLGNLGYIPKDIIGVSRKVIYSDKMQRTEAFIDRYKTELLAL